MKLAFTLSMPGNNSWNGRWSGEGNLYVKVIDVGASKKAAEKYTPMLGQSFGYSFGDGWYASVAVRQVDSGEARKLKKASRGFCGYDWMIDEIRYEGRIRTLAERKPSAAPLGKDAGAKG